MQNETNNTLKWYEDNDYLTKMVAYSLELQLKLGLNRSSETNIISLGQSPAWLCYTMAQVEKNISVHNIPFSGRCMKKNNKNIFTRGVTFPEDDKINLYKQNLEQLGLDPKSVLAMDGDVFLLEYTQSGESLVSFWEVYKIIAEKQGVDINELKEKIKFTVLSQGFNEDNRSFNGIYPKIIKIDTDIIVPIANGKDEGVDSDRIVPRYPVHSFTENIPKLINDEKIAEIKQNINQVIRTKNLNQPSQINLNNLNAYNIDEQKIGEIKSLSFSQGMSQPRQKTDIQSNIQPPKEPNFNVTNKNQGMKI